MHYASILAASWFGDEDINFCYRHLTPALQEWNGPLLHKMFQFK
jgi:hypothetical protein